MRFLKTNTATRITIGPFLDKSDGITPEVALTATNEHLTLMVDSAGVPTLVLDANATASGGDNDLVHVTNDDAGFYDLELTAAQLNYVGRAMLSINYVTDHCPVFHEFMILPANVYDSLVGTDKLDVNAAELGGTSQTGGDVPTLIAALPTDADVNAACDQAISDAGIADAVADEVYDGSYTLRQIMRGVAAALMGKTSGMGTGTGVIRDISDTKNRVSVTQDADGNRSVYGTLDLT